MRTIVLSAAAALLLGSVPATASIVTIGSSYAESCYRAADAGITSATARDACNSALTVEPLTLHDRVGTHVNRGILWMRAGDLVRASQDFDRALALDPNQAEAWLNKAIALVNSGNIPAAAQTARQALELGTRKPAIAYYIRAMSHEESGNLKAAYADLKRARELAPTWRQPAAELARYQVRSR